MMRLKPQIVVFLGVVLAALLVGDVLTTHAALNNGQGYEANPLARWSFEMIGFWPSAVIRIFIGGGVGWVALALARGCRPMRRYSGSTAACVAGTSYAVLYVIGLGLVVLSNARVAWG